MPRRARVAAAVLALFALTLCAAAFEAYRLREIALHARTARAQMLAARGLLDQRRLDATEADLDAARGQFSSASRMFDDVGGDLRRDPLIRVLRGVPYVDRQLDALVDLSEMGEDAAAIGVEAVDAAAEFERVRARSDATLPEQAPTIFDLTDPHVAAIETRLASIDARRARLHAALWPPIQDAVEEFDVRRDELAGPLATYQRSRAVAPGLLGFNGRRSYLVLAQNNAELLPTGGLISVAGVMQLDRGRVTSMEFEDAGRLGARWMAEPGNYVEPPPPLRRHLLKGMSWNLMLSNWSPDFPTSAREAMRFYQLAGGTPVDGVIAINVTTLVKLLAVTGPVEVPGYGVTVTSENAFDVTEEHTRAPFESSEDRKEFVGALAHEVFDRALGTDWRTWSPLIDTFDELVTQKDLLIYAVDPAEQETVRQLGWSGDVRDAAAGDDLMIVDASVNSTKLNAVLEQSVDVAVHLDAHGQRTVVAIDYFNNLAPWAQGKDPALVEKLMLGGVYGGYVRLFVPPGSAIVSARDQSGAAGIEEQGTELGRTVFGRFIALPRDQRARLQFEYVSPLTARAEGDGLTYRLRIWKQPGRRPIPVRLRVAPPDGMRIVSSTVGGHVGASPGEFDFTLSEDRLVEVRLVWE